jgi:hypothetical protein
MIEVSFGVGFGRFRLDPLAGEPDVFVEQR